METSSFSNKNKDKIKESSFKKESISINQEMKDSEFLLKELNNIPDNQYNCSECNLVPEILCLDYVNSMIEFKCPNHGNKIIEIGNYFKNESKYLNTNNKCELNNKCKIHSKNYNKYCKICKKYFCNEDKINCKHEINDIKKPEDKDIEKIKNKIDNLKKNIINEKYYIKILNTLIKSYEKHPSNYFYNINIYNVTQKIKDLDYIDSKLLLEKINEFYNLKPDIELKKNQLKIKLNGKEFELHFINNLYFNLLSNIEFSNLEELNLSHNCISDITPLSLLNSDKIKSIDLSFNKINSIPMMKDKNNIKYNCKQEIENLKKINRKLKSELENIKKDYEEKIKLLTSQINDANNLIINLKNKQNNNENIIQYNSNNNFGNNNFFQNYMQFPSITNIKVINNQIFLGLDMNQTFNSINNNNQNDLIIIFRCSSGIEIKINANPNMSVFELLNLFFHKTNLLEENKNKIFFLFQGSLLNYKDKINILKAKLFNESVITVIDTNNLVKPIN